MPLAATGLKVTGVDRAQVLLDEAKRRAGPGRWPKFVRADYRELPMPDESFDAALNLFSSLGYLGDEEDTRALAEIGRVLRPGGGSSSRPCTATCWCDASRSTTGTCSARAG